MREYIEYPENLNNIIPGTLHFYPDQITLLLDIDKKYIDIESKRSKAEQLGLINKSDFHLTIIGSDTGKKIGEIISQGDEEKRKNMINSIYQLAKLIEWKPKLKDNFFYIQKEYSTPDPSNIGKEIWEKRKSIVQTVEFEGIDEFYQKLNVLLGENFETPWAHITLYTTSTREDKKIRGIGIYSKKQFEELYPQTI